MRVPNLQEFRKTIAALTTGAVQGPGFRVQGSPTQNQEPTKNPEPRTLNQEPTQNPEPRTLNLSEVVIVVPTRAAAAILARTLGDVSAAATLVTRDELYDLLHARLANPPRRLTAIERDVMAQAAARAAAAGEELSFQLRPGLVAEMLRFYDHLRRQSQQVDRFEELILEALGKDDVDRATARMRTQTRFLARAFRDYERRVRQSGTADEHMLRERLMAEPAAAPIRHVIVSVGDWIADPAGLYSEDFNLLARIPGLEALDIVSTERLLASGFHERLHGWWPGLEERDAAAAPVRPVLLTPAGGNPDEPWWTHRDREEELVAIARYLKAGRRDGSAAPLGRTAVVYKHPLPYMYPAGEVFGAAGIPYEAFDALPLAAEPTAAALDLVLDAASSNFTRGTIVALLRSPHFVFRCEDAEIARESVAALDRALSQARYLGGVDRLEALAETTTGTAAPAMHAALAAAHALAPLGDRQPASAQIARLLAFHDAHLRPLADGDPFASRERRARAAVADTLRALTAVHAAHDDPAWTIDDLGIAVRRWLGEQTFAVDDPDASRSGITLVDDQAARYGDFDDVQVVGLIDGEWPERVRRSVLYPASLLALLEPLPAIADPTRRERDALQSARAAFRDLVWSPARFVRISTFALEHDAVVEPSLLLDDVSTWGLTTRAVEETHDRVSVSEALSLEPVRTEVAAGSAADGLGHEAFQGQAGSWRLPRVSVSRLERYLDCPFRFFASEVLRLEEQPEDEDTRTPLERGQFLHELWERFFAEWQKRGHRRITHEDLPVARELFEQLCEEALSALSPSEAVLERARLLGSAVGPGIAHRVFAMEAERPADIVERLLEFPLQGDFTFSASDGRRRTVPLSAKTDRIDVLAGKTLRVIDYKSKKTPDLKQALQLPIYSFIALESLRAARGGHWSIAEALYLSFEGDKAVVPLRARGRTTDELIADAQTRLIATLDDIAAGVFPPRPARRSLCGPCPYRTVCRLEYVESATESEP